MGVPALWRVLFAVYVALLAVPGHAHNSDRDAPRWQRNLDRDDLSGPDAYVYRHGHRQRVWRRGMSRRIEDLHPSFQPIVREIIRRANERGLYPFIMEGRREPEYQACLYAQGRLAVGSTSVFGGFKVKAEYSADKKHVVVSCGSARNLVAPSEWRNVVTQVGAYGSWHTLGLAVDFSFHSCATSTDHLIGDLESAAEKTKDRAKAANIRREIEDLYTRLAEVVNSVSSPVIWGNDWDDDGVMNGPDPDNEWSDLPHFEWHPGISRIAQINVAKRAEILAGRFPAAPAQCHLCKRFERIVADRICHDCYARMAITPHDPATATR